MFGRTREMGMFLVKLVLSNNIHLIMLDIFVIIEVQNHIFYLFNILNPVITKNNLNNIVSFNNTAKLERYQFKKVKIRLNCRLFEV